MGNVVAACCGVGVEINRFGSDSGKLHFLEVKGRVFISYLYKEPGRP